MIPLRESAPSPTQLFAYAKRLDMDWEKFPMEACGYRKLMAGHWEAIVDVGDIVGPLTNPAIRMRICSIMSCG